ncbi:ATP-dependent DNA helicase [Kiloniella sp. b19]|uniref:ATP-dependent DNA helicase n=1 Tax=Kiloniella sp. GXU_MW_B19 TaxID=3141326 RepID=UPI0031E1ADD4
MHDSPDQQQTAGSQQDILLPRAPLLLSGLRFSVWISPDGESERIANSEAAGRITLEPPVVCHGKAIAHRLGVDPFPCYDVLELIAFTHPATSCTPTPRGLAAFLGAPEPTSIEQATLLNLHTAEAMLRELAARGSHFDPHAAEAARNMMAGGWLWGSAVLAALGAEEIYTPNPHPSKALRVWERLEEWQETPPEVPQGHASVQPEEARQKLASLLGEGSEQRLQQADFTSAVSQAFAPRQIAGEPNLVLAEAGTGVGKTLGYIAPASLWAQKNEAPIWLSTYTRNLQTQIDGELDRLYPEPWKKKKKVVIRKGRENYLCLLNLEEAVSALTARPQDAIAVGLMSRWAAHSRNGDMVGGDFPGWLAELVGRPRTLGLTDRRGECIYAACPHYSRCFIERNIRKARKAEIVVANHALVLMQAAMGGGRDEGALPTHYVFDEGHHLFDAADSAFSAHLSAVESQELRRWLAGAETTSRNTSRARGLKKRIEELVATDTKTAEHVEDILYAARCLTGDGWGNRMIDAQPEGPMERFLLQVREQVYARNGENSSPYSLEAETHPVNPELLNAAKELKESLKDLLEPVLRLRKRLDQRLDEEAAEMESETRRKIESTCRTLDQRALGQLEAWISMLKALEEETPEDFTDWLSVERISNRDSDVGLHRHWVDPMRPFAGTLLSQAHGVVVTSATLTDGNISTEPRTATDDEISPDLQQADQADGDEWLREWIGAEQRSGAVYLPNSPIRARFPSPYNYEEQTKVLVVRDVRKDDLDQVAAAYRELFLASRGGALGLFTAISRLRAVHERIGDPLDRAGLTLYSQHIDGMDTSTLIDIFRAERDSCLLGTDAVRDGVDVPGESLRLIVFDRVPWPRPTIQHKARKARFGGNFYTDSQTRLKLKQAYGRLVRRASDRGVFVLLDPMMPTRLTNAFPPNVDIHRCGLAEAVGLTQEFLKPRSRQNPE